MYKDIISYKLAENKTEKELLNVAQRILDSWMKHQLGFLKWEIHKNSNNSYTDIVHWASEADAKTAEKNMSTMEYGAEWFSCYEEGSISSQNLNLISDFSA